MPKKAAGTTGEEEVREYVPEPEMEDSDDDGLVYVPDDEAEDGKVREYALRPYQEEAVETVNNLPDGSRSILALATGLGKTVTMSRFKRQGRLLILSHRDELVRQPKKYFPGISFGVEKSKEHSSGEEVVSASVQTLCKDRRLHAFNPDDFDILVVDEAHHAAAQSYRKVLDYFHPRKVIGLTATPKRGDKVRLTDVFDTICFSRDLRWGIENGYLSRLRYIRVYTDAKIGDVSVTKGDFQESDLELALSESNACYVASKTYVQHCYKGKRQTLIYCVTKTMCWLVEAALKAVLPEKEHDKLAVLTGETPTEERRDMLAKFSRSEIHCIINCMVLTEGYDGENVDCIMNLRPTINPVLYTQIVGRGTRLCEGKEYCLILDLVPDQLTRRPLCTAPTLLGIDPALLPKKMSEKLEGVDLLTAIDGIAGILKEQEQSFELHQEMLDIFADELREIITDNMDKGLKGIASAYGKYLTKDEDEELFGDIIAVRQPDEEAYYKIQTSMSGEYITLSRPDVLGNTVIRSNLWQGKAAMSFISPTLPWNEAIGIVKKILSVLPQQNAFLWSRKVRQEWGKIPATANQENRLERDYYRFGVRKFDGTTKQEASDLIDLVARELALRGEADEERKKHKKEKDPEKEAKRLEKLNREKADKEDQEERKKKAYDGSIKKLDEIYRSIEEEKKERRQRVEKMLAGKHKVLTVAVNKTYFSANRLKYKPSEKQVDFYNSLVRQITEAGSSFVVKNLPDMDTLHFGIILDFLIKAKEKVQYNKEVNFRFDAKRLIVDVLATGNDIESIPDTISCRYTCTAAAEDD